MTKSTFQAQTKPEVFVNFRHEPGLNPNPTRKARTDLQLCPINFAIFKFKFTTDCYSMKFYSYVAVEFRYCDVATTIKTITTWVYRGGLVA